MSSPVSPPINPPQPRNSVMGEIDQHFTDVIGKIQTLLDASLPPAQAKAAKDIAKQALWATQHAVKMTVQRIKPS